MIYNFNFLANFIFAVVTFVMGISFLSLNTPAKSGLNNYRISLKVLAVAYFALSFFAIFRLFNAQKSDTIEIISFIDLSISSIQALLFTLTLIVLINPRFIKLKKLFWFVLPFLSIAVLYLFSFFIYGDPKIVSIEQIGSNLQNPTLWIRLLLLLYYLFQLCFYTYLFIRESRRYNEEILNYFSDVVTLKLSWVQIAFYSALAIGIIAIFSSFLSVQFEWMFTILFTFFYLGFAQEYIQYNRVFTIIENAIVNPVAEVVQVPVRHLIKSDWEHYKSEILKNKYYCQSGVNIEDLAKKLNIGRTTLSNLINREESMNFNSWINRLRIEDSKKLLIDNPEFTIAIISELVGYTEQANFSRQFKLITGESPLYWRKKAAS